MDLALFTLRLLLAAVFGVAGMAKLADLAASRKVLIEFGLSRRLATPLARILPVVELVVATALLFPQLARYAAAGAFALLLLFSVAIAVNLARGRRPACRCFGQLNSAPVGWPTLARNALLGALAAFAALAETPHTNIVAWPAEVPGPILIACGVLVGVVVIQGWFMLHLLRQHGRILLRLDALEAAGAVNSSPRLAVGSRAPDFTLSDLETTAPVSLRGLVAAAKPVLIAFVDPDCASCVALLPQLAMWQRDYRDRLTAVVVSLGDPSRNRSTIAGLGLTHVLLQRQHEVAEQYHVAGTPSAVLVDPDGNIVAPLAEGIVAIRRLVGSAVPPASTSEVRLLEGSPVY